METKNCKNCYGAGNVLGGGSISRLKCDNCDGTGKVPDYTNSIKEIQKLNPHFSFKEAERIFMEEMNRINKQSKKLKRKEVSL